MKISSFILGLFLALICFLVLATKAKANEQEHKVSAASEWVETEAEASAQATERWENESERLISSLEESGYEHSLTDSESEKCEERTGSDGGDEFRCVQVATLYFTSKSAEVDIREDFDKGLSSINRQNASASTKPVDVELAIKEAIAKAEGKKLGKGMCYELSHPKFQYRSNLSVSVCDYYIFELNEIYTTIRDVTTQRLQASPPKRETVASSIRTNCSSSDLEETIESTKRTNAKRGYENTKTFTFSAGIRGTSKVSIPEIGGGEMTIDLKTSSLDKDVTFGDNETETVESKTIKRIQPAQTIWTMETISTLTSFRERYTGKVSFEGAYTSQTKRYVNGYLYYTGGKEPTQSDSQSVVNRVWGAYTETPQSFEIFEKLDPSEREFEFSGIASVYTLTTEDQSIKEQSCV